jgi:hypothetical protein
MRFFIDGESICASMVKAILAQYKGAPPHIVDAHSLKNSSASGASTNKGTISQNQNICANCNKGAEKLLLCGKCKLVKYCSRDCQVAHFKSGHKKVCKAPASI